MDRRTKYVITSVSDCLAELGGAADAAARKKLAEIIGDLHERVLILEAARRNG